MLKLTPIEYLMHLKDIYFTKTHDFPSPELLLARQFRSPIYQFPTLYPPVSDLKFYNQVDVCRYFICKYWEFGSDARYVRCQSRGWEIQPLYLSWQPSCLPQLSDGMLGLSPSLNKQEIILDAWLKQGLIFDDEIAGTAQQRSGHTRQFQGSKKMELKKILKQPLILRKD